jgi:hypothetical protein
VIYCGALDEDLPAPFWSVGRARSKFNPAHQNPSSFGCNNVLRLLECCFSVISSGTGEAMQLNSVCLQMVSLPKQKVSLPYAYYSENCCENNEPKGIDSEFALSIFFLFCLGGIGGRSAYL